MFMDKDKCLVNATCTIHKQEVWVNDQLLYKLEKEEPFPVFAKAAYRHLGISYPRFFKMDQLSKLGFLCTELLVKEYKNWEAYNGGDIGIFIGNKNASLDTDDRYWQTVIEEPNAKPSPSLFVYTLPNILIGEVCKRHQILGDHTFLVDHTFDTNFFTEYVMYLLETKVVTTAIIGWVELYQENYKAKLIAVEEKDKCSETKNKQPFSLKTMEMLFET